MTKSPVLRIGDLLPKFLTNALIFFTAFHPARAIAAGPFQAFPYHLYHFLILVKSDSHSITPLPIIIFYPEIMSRQNYHLFF